LPDGSRRVLTEDLLLGGLRPLAFGETYAGAAAVPVDEFNAGRFQSVIRCCH
jgi:hypothetical protein